MTRTEKEIKKLFVQAVDCEDGHFYDADECWYCGYITGIQATLLYFLGELEFFQKVENGSRRMRTAKRKKSNAEYYNEFRSTKTTGAYN